MEKRLRCQCTHTRTHTYTRTHARSLACQDMEKKNQYQCTQLFKMIHVVICSVNNDTNYGWRSLMLQEKARMQGEINKYHISNYTQSLSITAIKRRKTNISSRLFGIQINYCIVYQKSALSSRSNQENTAQTKFFV